MNRRKTTAETIDPMHTYVIGEPNSGCWLWTAGQNGLGYGVVSLSNPRRQVLAHRESYRQAYGEFPAHLYVLHKCDTPACVRPEHLFLGTPMDNMQDKIAKGRHHGKLTKCQVLEIRNSKEPSAALAVKFGVSARNVRYIKAGQSWNSPARQNVSLPWVEA